MKIVIGVNVSITLDAYLALFQHKDCCIKNMLEKVKVPLTKDVSDSGQDQNFCNCTHLYLNVDQLN